MHYVLALFLILLLLVSLVGAILHGLTLPLHILMEENIWFYSLYRPVCWLDLGATNFDDYALNGFRFVWAGLIGPMSSVFTVSVLYRLMIWGGAGFAWLFWVHGTFIPAESAHWTCLLRGAVPQAIIWWVLLRRERNRIEYQFVPGPVERLLGAGESVGLFAMWALFAVLLLPLVFFGGIAWVHFLIRLLLG